MIDPNRYRIQSGRGRRVLSRHSEKRDRINYKDFTICLGSERDVCYFPPHTANGTMIETICWFG